MTVKQVFEILENPKAVTIAVNGNSVPLFPGPTMEYMELIQDYVVNSISASGELKYELGISMKPERV